MIMKYKLKSGLASYEGTHIGEKEFTYPATRKKVEKALEEALMELAELQEEVDMLNAHCQTQD